MMDLIGGEKKEVGKRNARSKFVSGPDETGRYNARTNVAL